MAPARSALLSAIPSYAVVLFLLLPLAAVVPISLTSRRYLSMPTDGISFRHYAEILTNGAWQSGILLSVSIGVAVAILATLLAALFAIGIWYARPAIAAVLVVGVLLPMALPPIISALALFFFTTKVNLYDTVTGVVVAHTVMAVPYCVVTLLVALSQVDRRLELAARNLGASLAQTTLWVVLPNIKIGIASALLLAFVLSWEEISVTIFITSVEVTTLPKLMWSGLRDNIDPIIASISVVVICISTLLAVIQISKKPVS